jgi:hypothetical protein
MYGLNPPLPRKTLRSLSVRFFYLREKFDSHTNGIPSREEKQGKRST